VDSAGWGDGGGAPQALREEKGKCRRTAAVTARHAIPKNRFEICIRAPCHGIDRRNHAAVL
jgi:hypothetical protein